MVKCNVTFENTVLQVPGPIPIAGEDKNNPIIKSSNKKMTVQNVSSQQKPGGPSDQNASAETPIVDQIVSDLENLDSSTSETKRKAQPTFGTRTKM